MYNVTPSAVGVIVNKVVGNRYIEKRVNIRSEHIRHSKCRQEFLDRVKRNHDAHVAAREKGGESHSWPHSSMRSCFPSRASDLEAHPRTTSSRAHCLDPGQRAADDGSCSLRDHYLSRYTIIHLRCARTMGLCLAIVSSMHPCNDKRNTKDCKSISTRAYYSSEANTPQKVEMECGRPPCMGM